MTTLAIRPPVAATALDLLDRSQDRLVAACGADQAADRYQAAHLAALRSAAAVLAVRSRPSRRGGVRSVWELLPAVVPELAEWAAFFAAGAPRRAAIEAGRTDVVGIREADDLLRQAEVFHRVVEQLLGLPGHPAPAHRGIGGRLIPLTG